VTKADSGLSLHHPALFKYVQFVVTVPVTSRLPQPHIKGHYLWPITLGKPENNGELQQEYVKYSRDQMVSAVVNHSETIDIIITYLSLLSLSWYYKRDWGKSGNDCIILQFGLLALARGTWASHFLFWTPVKIRGSIWTKSLGGSLGCWRRMDTNQVEFEVSW
jgi:hypothetical protein